MSRNARALLGALAVALAGPAGAEAPSLRELMAASSDREVALDGWVGLDAASGNVGAYLYLAPDWLAVPLLLEEAPGAGAELAGCRFETTARGLGGTPCRVTALARTAWDGTRLVLHLRALRRVAPPGPLDPS